MNTLEKKKLWESKEKRKRKEKVRKKKLEKNASSGPKLAAFVVQRALIRKYTRGNLSKNFKKEMGLNDRLGERIICISKIYRTLSVQNSFEKNMLKRDVNFS